MKACSVEGCGGKHRAKGYCKKHYNHMYKYGKILKRTRSDPNEIVIKGDIAEIILYNRENQEVARTVIDAEDVEKVKRYKWSLHQGYVTTYPKSGTIKIQHVISGVKPDRKNLIDHKDRKPLNNRKSNFRFCTQSKNLHNRTKQKNNTSGFKGVSKDKEKWRATISTNKKWIYLGAFKDKIKAARAYNKAAIKYHGEFACLNEI